MKKFLSKLEEVGYQVYEVKNKKEALTLSRSLIKPGMSVGLGGSTSVKDIGLLDDLIKRDDITLFNQYEVGISMEENFHRRRN